MPDIEWLEGRFLGEKSVNSLEKEIILRLILSCVLGTIIGIERERLHRAAGLRTHVLVCIGSALFTVTSIYGFSNGGTPVDPSRIAAQIVSGIGFLGAGTIMKHGATVRGLTTAASLWLSAGIGMAAGCGAYLTAIFVTLLAVASLVLFKKIEGLLLDGKVIAMEVRVPEGPGQIAKIQNALEDGGGTLKNVEIFTEEGMFTMRILLHTAGEPDKALLLQKITDAGAMHIEW